MAGYRIAVVGATGLVGQTLFEVLQEKALPISAMVPLASDHRGRFVDFEGQKLPVESLDDMDWTRVDVAFFAAGNAVSESYAPRALEAGVTVIDKSSQWRLNPDVPLVVPEVNGEEIRDHRLIASPNCSTIQLVIALAPLDRRFGIEQVIVSTYQAVSGTGREAVQELEHQTRQHLEGKVPEGRVYPVPIVHNVLPYCDQFGDADYTEEEWKLTRETAKILGRNLALSATAVRVPVFVGHAESVYIKIRQDWTLEEVREALQSAPSVQVMDNPAQGLVPTPRDAAGGDQVLVGRIRRDLHVPRGLHLFVVADNLRRGAATNAVDIMQLIAARWSIGVAR